MENTRKYYYMELMIVETFNIEVTMGREGIPITTLSLETVDNT